MDEHAHGTGPQANKRGPGRPRKNEPPYREPDRTSEAPAVEPDEVDEPPVDELGRPLSLLWAEMRGAYTPKVRRVVERLMRRGPLELDDLVHIEIANAIEMQELMDGATERFQERLLSMQLQSRKQLMRIIVERGPVGGVNARAVRVPEGLDLDFLTRPPDLGDNILEPPDPAKLPAHLRATVEPRPGGAQ